MNQSSVLGSLLTPGQVDHAIDLHEQKIAQLRNDILSLKSRRNAFSSISRLPPELLGEIFVALVQSCAAFFRPPHPRYKAPRSRSRDWVAINMVCRHWRDVALRTTHIWSYVYLQSHLETLKLFLDRSGQVPLKLATITSSVLPKEVLTCVVQNMGRVESIRIRFDKTLSVLSQTQPLNAPLLDSLMITGLSVMQDFSGLAQARWPRLKVLSCAQTSFRFIQATVRPTLTSLKVTHMRLPEPPITWLNLLHSIPHLETLELEDAITSTDTVSSRSMPQLARAVTLPNLKFLLLGDTQTGAACAHLLAQLLIPTNVEIVIEGTKNCTPEDYRSIFSTCAAKQAEPSAFGAAQPILGMVIGGNLVGDYGYTIVEMHACNGSPLHLEPYGPKRDFPVIDDMTRTLTFALYGSPKAFLKTARDIYPLQELTKIRINLYEITEEIMSQLSLFPNIREIYLKLHVRTATALIQYIQKPGSFSRLEKLVLSDLIWGQPRRERSRQKPLVLALVATLAARKDQGVRLKYLELPNAKGLRKDLGDLDQLRAQVEYFECDVLEEAVKEAECGESDCATGSLTDSDLSEY